MDRAIAIVLGLLVVPLTALDAISQTVPGVYVAEVGPPPSVVGLSTSQTAIVGRFAKGLVNVSVIVTSAEFLTEFGSGGSAGELATYPAEVQARLYFANGGSELQVVRLPPKMPLPEALLGEADKLTGLYALEPSSDLRILLAPEISTLGAVNFATVFPIYLQFATERGVFFIVDPPPTATTVDAAIDWASASIPVDAAACATYFPSLLVTLPGLDVPHITAPASGSMAGIFVTNDANVGIWNHPAGTSLPTNALGVTLTLDAADGAINWIRDIEGFGVVPWGSRTLDRSNLANREIGAVRFLGWTMASIQRSLAFAAYEENDVALWLDIRSSVSAFFNDLWQSGALEGETAEESYTVTCDATTTSPADVAAHRVNLDYELQLDGPVSRSLTAMTLDPDPPVPRPQVYLIGFPSVPRLTFDTVPGFEYTVETDEGMSTEEWEPLAPVFSGYDGWRHATIPASATAEFYRVQVATGNP